MNKMTESYSMTDFARVLKAKGWIVTANGITDTVEVGWKSEPKCFVAYGPFDTYGTGDTREQAVNHLAEILIEEYQDLAKEAGNLHPDLEAKREQMTEAIAPGNPTFEEVAEWVFTEYADLWERLADR